jgi:protoporphyrinogen oxidase
MRGLPPELIAKVIADFVAVRHGVDRIAPLQPSDVSRQEGSTYADWLYAAYGKKFAETFPMVYGEKYHTTTMDKLTTDWIGPRMHMPSLEELVHGALERRPSTTHYVDVYRYPSNGGFVAYLESFARKCDLRLNHELASIDPQNKVLRFTNEAVHRYSAVISSIPVPALVPMIEGVPQEVLDASRRLAFTTAVLVNIGIDRSDISDTAITYFYDPDVICSRVNLPHMFSKNNAPSGCGSIQAEIYFSHKYKPIDAPLEVLARRAVADLTRCGFVRPDDKILMLDTMVNEYANVIYDFDRPAALRIVHDFLKDVGITWCGRYGQWNHDWTDQAFLDGERAAEEVLTKVQKG